MYAWILEETFYVFKELFIEMFALTILPRYEARGFGFSTTT